MRSKTRQLTEEQVAAAGALHATLRQWRLTDESLSRLGTAVPGFGPAESLLKVVAVNALYGTNLFALVRAAEHVRSVLEGVDVGALGPEVVERLAAVPASTNGRHRRHTSFASKFAHFFISADRFPIYDSYAERMLSLHLGPMGMRDPTRPYEAFVKNLDTLRVASDLARSYRDLDRYLWVAGQYRAYLDGKPQLNVELRRVFEKPSAEQRALLETILGS